MFSEHRIFDIDKQHVLQEDFVLDLKKRKEAGFNFYVGADSQMYFDYITFVITICYHHREKGAGAYYIKKRTTREEFPSLRARMTREMFLALEAAMTLQDILSLSTNDITVHLDIGSNPLKNRTHVFHKEFTSIVKSQGYNVEIKPHSWASSDVADWFTK